MTESFLTSILLVTIAFLLIISLVVVFQERAEAGTSMTLCKSSIALRDKTYTEFEAVGGLVKGSLAFPSLCKTIDTTEPDKKTSKEQIMKQFSTKMAKCWEQFGEGKIKNVFKEGDPINKNCFVCYTVNLRESDGLKKGETITSAEMLQYLFNEGKTVFPTSDNCKGISGGFCAPSKLKSSCPIDADQSYIKMDEKNEICKEKKPVCCSTNYACWNLGGTCKIANPDETDFVKYDGWKCPSNLNCYVSRDRFLSYGDYIQKAGGPGKPLVTTDLTPGETYAISFGSPTPEDCTWCTKAGLAVGVAVGIALVPVTWGTSLGIVAASAGALAAGGAVAIGTEIAVEEIFKSRDTNTIYLSTLNQIQNAERYTGEELGTGNSAFGDDFCTVVT